MLPSFLQNTFFGGVQPQRRAAQYTDSLMALNAYNSGRYNMESGDKILLPASALQQLIQNRQTGPMTFRLTNTVNNKVVYVGVLEFIAEEGTCVVPNWIFQDVKMFEGCQVMIHLVTKLPKGRLIKLQPHETAFIDLPDPRAVLENSLRKYLCLTQGQTITVEFANKQYQIDILKVNPESEFKAVDINDADIEIDFAPPLDYEEAPPNLLKKPSSTLKCEDQESTQQSFIFSGKGVRLDGKQDKPQDRKPSEDLLKQQQPQQEPYNPRRHRLNHGVKVNIEGQKFQGTGVQLQATKPTLKK